MNDITDGELELLTYKFKKYLSGVQRYIRNQQLIDRPYRWDERKEAEDGQNS